MNRLGEYLYVRSGYFLFTFCIVASGVIGAIFALRTDQPFFVAAPAIAVAFFVLAYCLVGLRLLTWHENLKGMQLQKPSFLWGILLSAIAPLVLAAAVIARFFVLIWGMHDSM